MQRIVKNIIKKQTGIH